MARPQIHAFARFAIQLEAQRLQACGDFFVRCGQAFAQGFQMLAPAAIGDHVVDQSFGHLGTGQAREHLLVRELLHDALARQQISHAQIGRHGLGKTAQIDHAVELIEAGERRLMAGVHVGVDVVFDQHEVMLRGPFQKLVHLRKARA